MTEKTKPLYRELARRELARRSYGEYLALVQGPGWKRTALSSYLAREIQSFLETPSALAYDILVIETPPQHGKSTAVTETLPSWYLGKHPDARVIIASYDSEFAERFCRRNRDKLRAFGPALFIGAVDRANGFDLSGGRGGLISRGIMSGITGNPAELILIDDPVKNALEADSPTFRARLWEEWQSSLKSRLTAGGKVIVIMTPWHEDDFAARVLAREPSARLIRLPVEAEESDPLGRQPGEPLCPELGKDAAWLREFKRGIISDRGGGSRAWQALYMCSPRTEEGNIVRRDWWRFYDPAQLPAPAFELISVDAAFKDEPNGDFVSIQVWGSLRGSYYLEYCLNRRLDFPGTIRAIRAAAELFPRARAVLIEDKANGPAVIQTLSRELFCIPVNPLGGKVARVNAVAPAIEAGRVYLPEPAAAAWVTDFMEQFTSFPNAAHDDMVDAASQALNRLIFTTDGAAFEAADLPGAELRAFLEPELLFDPYSA